jgi:hypothetical protein
MENQNQGGYQQGGYGGGYGGYGGGFGGGYGGYPPYGGPPPPPPFGGPGYGGYGGFNGMHPQSYSRMQYQYGGAYNANAAYMVPMGVPPIIAQKMMAASNAFRFFDKDHTGFLNKEEWAQCMGYLGITIPESEMDRLYQMIDFDNSGHIGEREFCEWFSSCY